MFDCLSPCTAQLELLERKILKRLFTYLFEVRSNSNHINTNISINFTPYYTLKVGFYSMIKNKLTCMFVFEVFSFSCNIAPLLVFSTITFQDILLFLIVTSILNMY